MRLIIKESIDSTLQKYKDFSIKYNDEEPADLWDIYMETVFDVLRFYFTETQRLSDYWDSNFESCVGFLKNKSQDLVCWHFDTGFLGLIITENYKLGFKVRYEDSSYGSKGFFLSYDDVNNADISETFSSFDELCRRADDLSNHEFSKEFTRLEKSYNSVKDIIDFYENHITYKLRFYKERGRSIDYYCDGTLICSVSQWLNDIDWKI